MIHRRVPQCFGSQVSPDNSSDGGSSSSSSLTISSPPPPSPSTCGHEMSSHGVHMVSSHFHVKPIFVRKPRNSPSLVRATSPQKHVCPDPIPEFAASETRKFELELREKLSRDIDTFGEDLDSIIQVCTQCLRDQMFSEFLREEYGGPGTLLVDPFTDTLVALKENNLPGAALAVRASLLWAQNFVYQDCRVWNATGSS